MRSGIGRGVGFASVIGLVLAVSPIASTAIAGDWFHHTIPRETLAQDTRTGDVMMAPPIPYGEYVKDYKGAIHGAIGHLRGLCSKCGGALCGICGGKGSKFGNGCGSCGGTGCGGLCGRGLFGGHGHGHGQGDACGDGSCAGRDGGILGHGGSGGGGGLFGHGRGGKGQGSGLFHGHSHGANSAGYAVAGGAFASGQQVVPSAQTVPCGSCRGKGCGLCGGSGFIKKLLGHGGGFGNGLCGNGGACGDPACGDGAGHGGMNRCGKCGGAGRGCGHCGGSGLCGDGCGLGSHLQAAKGLAHGLVNKVLHRGEVKYFVGPGGPVPLTPGYVPYVVTTRSPRDYFAFPPYSERE